MGSVLWRPYPGLDGHPRRIVPTPFAMGKKVGTTAQDSGVAPQPTIGNTSISSTEAAAIRAEVRLIMDKEFAEGRAALRATFRLHEEKTEKSGRVSQSELVVSLATELETRATMGSPISVASTNSHIGNNANTLRITQLSPGASVSSPSRTFATVAWKPKEPLCFFGQSTEDAHTGCL